MHQTLNHYHALRPSRPMTTLYQSLKEFEVYAVENAEHKAQTDTALSHTMDLIETINKARVDERATILKSLNRVSKTLEVDSNLKSSMQNLVESNTTNPGNITGLTELLRNANLLEILTQMNAFQTSLNALSTQCANISESLKEDPEFNQRLLKAAECYIQNSTRLTDIANSLREINFPSLQARIISIENS
ncbi:hypothetical protein Tco_1067755 [Tanacetum coccineum]|uniref:Uncharacterized protein n=1 Tax=Tanacetum coccineum TaxID=301880 RepID=A0ABQ5HDY9_9ASTR